MSTLAGILLLAAGEVAGFFAIWFLLKARIRRYLELDELLAGVREEARSLVTELNATADRNVSLVEDRIASLRELLSEVDKRLGIARRELENREVEKEVYARLSQRRPIVPSSQPSTPAHERPHERPHERAQEPIPLTLGGSEGASEPIAMPEIRVAAEPVKALFIARDSRPRSSPPGSAPPSPRSNSSSRWRSIGRRPTRAMPSGRGGLEAWARS
jgi:hypothetical protein